MSRSRSRYVRPKAQYDTYLNGGLLNRVIEPYLGTAYDYSSWYSSSDQTNYAKRETMVDNLSTTGTYRDINAVTHSSQSYANLTNSGVSYSYDHPVVKSLSMHPVFCGMHYTPSTSGFSAPPWPTLVTQLADKIDAGIETSALLGVTLAEITKTISMVRNPFNLLKADWRKISRNHTASQLSKAGANIWLEAQYGWLSAYYDIKAFSKAYKSCHSYLTAEPSDFERFSASQDEIIDPGPVAYLMCTESQWNSVSADVPLTWSPPSGTGGYYRAQPLTVKRKCRVGCERLLDVSNRLTTSQAFVKAFGISPNSILPTLWELVPFSFVIDWFVDPRGIWANRSLERLKRADVRRLCYSTKVEYEATIQAIHKYIFSGYTILGGKAPTSRSSTPIVSGNCSGKSYIRASGGPSISDFRAGFLTANLSSTQLASGFSLLIQRLTNRH